MSGSVEALQARYGPAYRWLVTVTAMAGTVSMVMSMTSINVAIPDVIGAFGIGQDKAQWMSTAYVAVMTAGMLLNAWLVSIFGERTVFVTVLGTFTVGAVIGGTAPSIDAVIFARALQGGSAGILQPLAMATLFRVFPPERRGFAMGLFGLGVVFAPAIGPTLGGIVIELASWHDVFFLPLPFCLAAMVLGTLFMPSRPWPERIPRFDWLGFALVSGALFALLEGMASGQRDGWSSDGVVTLLAGGAAMAVAFVVWESITRTPLLDITLFASPQFSAAAVIALIFGASILGSTYIIPVFTQTVQGYTPLKAGLLMMPAGLLLAVIFPVAGRVSDSMPPHFLLIGGLATFCLAFFLMSTADVSTTFWTFATYTFISRLGLGFINPVLNATALKALPPEKVSQGAGVANFIRQLGGAFGINGLVAFLDVRTHFHDEALTATQTWANSTTTKLLGQVEFLMSQAGIADTVQEPGALYYLGQVVHAQGSALGFQDAFLAVSVVGLLAMIPAWLLRRAKRPAVPLAQAPAERPEPGTATATAAAPVLAQGRA